MALTQLGLMDHVGVSTLPAAIGILETSPFPIEISIIVLNVLAILNVLHVPSLVIASAIALHNMRCAHISIYKIALPAVSPDIGGGKALVEQIIFLGYTVTHSIMSMHTRTCTCTAKTIRGGGEGATGGNHPCIYVSNTWERDVLVGFNLSTLWILNQSYGFILVCSVLLLSIMSCRERLILVLSNFLLIEDWFGLIAASVLGINWEPLKLPFSWYTFYCTIGTD